MATKTYYAKIDCHSAVATAENMNNEVWTGFYNFMTYMSATNVVTLVAMNTGSIQNGGTSYWEVPTMFGNGAHFIYRWNSSSARPFDWYMCAQVVSTSANVGLQTFNVPCSGWGNGTLAGGGSNRGILISAAVCVSGTTSFNPWNGTGGINSDAKGNPVWVSGANDRNLWVLPRSNDPLGSHATAKNNMGTFGRYWTASTTLMRYHFFSDGDALLFLNDVGDVANYSVHYLGPYELRNNLSSSGIANSAYGICMLASAPNAALVNTITLGATWGDTAGTTVSTPNGGIIYPSVTGSRTGINGSVATTFLINTMQKNTFTNQFDEFPVYVGMSEGANFGLLGNLNSGLIRYITGLQCEDITSDGLRAIFGGSTDLTNIKISVPWTGSYVPRLGMTREGTTYTWTHNYG